MLTFERSGDLIHIAQQWPLFQFSIQFYKEILSWLFRKWIFICITKKEGNVIAFLSGDMFNTSRSNESHFCMTTCYLLICYSNVLAILAIVIKCQLMRNNWIIDSQIITLSVSENLNIWKKTATFEYVIKI